MKKFVFGLSLILAVLALCLTSCGSEPVIFDHATELATTVLTLDINPGVRFYVDDDQKVLKIEAVNEDAVDIVNSLSVENQDLETAVEKTVEKLVDQGYLDEESNSVLVSFEKRNGDEVAEKVRQRINQSMKKKGIDAAVIEQDVAEVAEEISSFAEEAGITVGKANLIEKIREELPELDGKELAELRMNDLNLILETVSEELRGQFKCNGKPNEGRYIDMKAAIEYAIADAGLAEDDIGSIHFKSARYGREDGRMVLMVYIRTVDMEYEYIFDAETGEILEREIENYKEFDISAALDSFLQEHEDELKDFLDDTGLSDWENKIFNDAKDFFDRVHGQKHESEDRGEKPDDREDDKGDRTPETEEKPSYITRAEAMKQALETLKMAARDLRRTNIRVLESEEGCVIQVELTVKNGDVYRVYIEAGSGIIVKAECNGEKVEIALPEAETEVAQ